jgi:flagellar assembly protein FliH
MAKILNAQEGKHIVETYAFKNFDFSGDLEDKFIKTEFKASDSNNVKENVKDGEVDSSTTKQLDSNQMKLIEQLLNKSDELSSVIVRMEKQLSKQSSEYEKRLLEVQDTKYKEGYNDGYNKAKIELESKINEHLSKLIESVNKIDDVYKEYQSKAENIEKELVGVAIDIAEQVIEKELSKSSKEIALSLTKELLNDINEATKIEIKVNPLDYDYVSKNLDLERVEVKPDNAISLGGVVILSDAGNIEAEIHERFKTIKNSILKVKE